MQTKIKQNDGEFKKLLAEAGTLNIPKPGDVVKGIILTVAKNEIRIDLPEYKTGVVRGPELSADSAEFSGLKPGAEVEATVLDMESHLLAISTSLYSSATSFM